MKQIWTLYNEYINNLGKSEGVMKEYKQIFTAGDEPGITIIKIRLIQEMIQIQRPKKRGTKRFEELVKDIVSIEKYNYKKKHQLQQFNVKWNLLR